MVSLEILVEEMEVPASTLLKEYRPMMDKRLREIAALEVELAMTEAHVQKLSATVCNASYHGEGSQVTALLKEENERADALRQKIQILKNRT